MISLFWPNSRYLTRLVAVALCHAFLWGGGAVVPCRYCVIDRPGVGVLGVEITVAGLYEALFILEKGRQTINTTVHAGWYTHTPSVP